MAWDINEPQNTTKLRNLGNVIRPNWQAIEDADATFKPDALNLDNRTALAPLPADPVAIADAMILYCKEDGSGDPQLYTINPASVISQLTGSAAFTAASPGKLVLNNGFTIIWGTGNASDTGFNLRNIDLGGFPANCFHISGSANGSTGAIGFQTVSRTQYRVKSSNAASSYFYFAIGN